MRLRASLLLLPATILIVSANATTPRKPQPRSTAASPVRCQVADHARYTSRRSAHMLAPPQALYAPPPLPAIAPPAPNAPMLKAPAEPMLTPQANSAVAGVIARPSAPYGAPGNTERYAGKEVAAVRSVAQAPVSTFSIDVDTGSYANVRRFLTQGQPVPAEAVRTEEMINYFRYDYPRPVDRAVPFSITTDVARTPWNEDTRLIRIGLRGYDVASATRPAANLVFLIDVSGSMDEPDKLPLVKQALTSLADKLRPDDRVSIVVYAGAAGMVLAPTANKVYVKAALRCLDAGGSTAGAEGIQLAYDIARANFRKDGINRIFLATDGDFNVGISDDKALEALIKRNRDDGITLTTLGFGEGNYNEAMMEHIADVGNGNYAYIDGALEARKVLDDELSATLVTIAKDVKIQVEFNPAQIKEYRLIGYENRALAEEDFRNDAVDAGDMGAGHQVTALYEVVPAGTAGWLSDHRYDGNRAATPSASTSEAAYVKLRYKLPEGTVSREIDQPVAAAMLTSAQAPRGDMAFATAVAAYGQKLRGDKYLGQYGWSDIAALAQPAGGYARVEFLRLLELATRKGNG